MSWTATAYVAELLKAPNGEPITKAEKLVLFVLSDCHHPHVKLAWPSVVRLAQLALMSERQAQYALKSLAAKGLVEVVDPPCTGRGYTRAYRFPALDKKGAESAPFRSGQAGQAGQEGCKNAKKRVQEGCSGASRNKEEPRTYTATEKSITPGGVLRKHLEAWLGIKKKLRAELPPEEWKLWVRPARLLRMMGGTMLVALPPGGEIISAAMNQRRRLQELAKPDGYAIVLTVYPDDWQRSELKRRHGIDLTPKEQLAGGETEA